MTIERVLEPEVMDSLEEAIEYDAMDFIKVNTAFAEEASILGPKEQGLVLDAGTESWSHSSFTVSNASPMGSDSY